MSTHSIFFPGEIRKISILFKSQKANHLIKSYDYIFLSPCETNIVVSNWNCLGNALLMGITTCIHGEI